MATRSDSFRLDPASEATGTGWRLAALAFVTALVAAVVFVAAFFIAYARLHDGVVVPGVRVAGVDLAGLDPVQAESRLRTSLPSVSSGSLRLEVGEHVESIAYADVGRDYLIDTAFAQAFSVGRTGQPLDLIGDQLRSLVRGTDIRLEIGYDRAALAARVASAVAAAERPALDAAVASEGDRFVARPGADGVSVDTDAAMSAAGFSLDAAGHEDVTIELSPDPVAPRVTTAEAEAAAAAANAMIAGPVVVRDGDRDLPLAVEVVRRWVGTSATPDGGYAATVDRAAVTASVEELAKTLRVPAREALFGFEGGGRIVAIPGQDGRTVDVPATVDRVVAAVQGRATGAPEPTVELASTAVPPSFTTAEAQAAVPRVRRVSSWTTNFVPGRSNFNGRNIAIPTTKIDGTAVGPGKVFDFWKVVGRVSRAEGYGSGGAIINGRTEPTGALAGGICSCSTTIFNAALRYGLEMGKRQNHYYYITRYPVGLDATVWKSSSGAQQTMTFRNDTEYPLLIRGINRPGQVRFDIYSVPSGRKVTFSRPRRADPVQARDTIEYTDELRPGATERVEYPADGFNVWVTRTVRDRPGAIIHQETFFSHYSRVDGVTLVGRRPGDPPDGTIVYVGG